MRLAVALALLRQSNNTHTPSFKTLHCVKMPVAVVTGSNKGIGFGIVRALCKQFSGDVYLTSRDEARGQAAVAELNKEGLQPKFHVLDIGNEETVTKFRDFIKEKHGGIDVLVNNAGIAFKQAATEPFGVQVLNSCHLEMY